MPSSVYKIDEASSGLSERERNNSDSLPGQHVSDAQIPGGAAKTGEPDTGPACFIGSNNQQKDITTVTSAGDNISASSDSNSANEGFTSTR